MNDELLNEIQELRTRLNQIEKQVRGSNTTIIRTDTPVPTSYTPVQRSSEEVARAMRNVPRPIAPSVRLDPASVHTDHKEPKSFGTGGFLGIIGILCFVLAASFFIEMAIQSGWLTPTRQMLLAAMFGVSVIFAGFVLKNRDIPYVSMLPGSGIVVLFLTAYGAGYVYHLISEPATLGCIYLISIFSLVLYFFFRQIYYVLIAAVGAYFCPLLITKAAVTLTDFMILFAGWDLTFAYLSVKLKRREINLVASYLALLVFFEQTFTGGQQTDMALIAWFQFAQFLIFFGAMIKHSIQQNKPLVEAEAWAFFPLLFLFYELEYIVVNRISDGLAPILSLGFGALILGIYFFSKKALPRKNLESGPMVYGFCAIVLYQSLYWENRTSMHSPWFAVIVMLALPFFSKMSDGLKKNFIVMFVVFFILLVEYCKLLISYSTFGGAGYAEYMFLNFTFSFMLAMGYLINSKTNKGQKNENWFMLLFVAYIQALYGLFKFAKVIASGFSMGHGDKFLVSVLWGLFAIMILTLGKFRKDAFFARTSMFVFALSIGKVFFYDLEGVTPMVRILSLMALGVVLYFGGYLYRHIETWEK